MFVVLHCSLRFELDACKWKLLAEEALSFPQYFSVCIHFIEIFVTSHFYGASIILQENLWIRSQDA